MTIMDPATVDAAVGELTVGTFNIEHFGWKEDRGHPGLLPALEWMLEQTPVPPDILFLPEATAGLENRQKAIELTTNHLSDRLEGGWYRALHSSQYLGDARNHLYLQLVNLAKVRVIGWNDPFRPGPRSAVYHGCAQCVIFGHEVWTSCTHWEGGIGPAPSEAQVGWAVALSAGGQRAVILGGDKNRDSGWEGERHVIEQLDWEQRCADDGMLYKLLQKGRQDPVTGEWHVDTWAIDYLRKYGGYSDAGEEAGDPTPTTRARHGSGLRIDRILRSKAFPARVKNYMVRMPPKEISDHAYVVVTYEVVRAVHLSV